MERGTSLFPQIRWVIPFCIHSVSLVFNRISVAATLDLELNMYFPHAESRCPHLPGISSRSVSSMVHFGEILLRLRYWDSWPWCFHNLKVDVFNLPWSLSYPLRMFSRSLHCTFATSQIKVIQSGESSYMLFLVQLSPSVSILFSLKFLLRPRFCNS